MSPRDREDGVAFEKQLPDYSSRLWQGLYRQWKAREFCDLKVHTTDGAVLTHACVWSAFSPAMEKLVREENKDGCGRTLSVTLQVRSEVVSSIALALYTGTFSPRHELLAQLYTTASFLGLQDLLEMMMEYSQSTAGYGALENVAPPQREPVEMEEEFEESVPISAPPSTSRQSTMTNPVKEQMRFAWGRKHRTRLNRIALPVEDPNIRLYRWSTLLNIKTFTPRAKTSLEPLGQKESVSSPHTSKTSDAVHNAENETTDLTALEQRIKKENDMDLEPNVFICNLPPSETLSTMDSWSRTRTQVCRLKSSIGSQSANRRFNFLPGTNTIFRSCASSYSRLPAQVKTTSGLDSVAGLSSKSLPRREQFPKTTLNMVQKPQQPISDSLNQGMARSAGCGERRNSGRPVVDTMFSLNAGTNASTSERDSVHSKQSVSEGRGVSQSNCTTSSISHTTSTKMSSASRECGSSAALRSRLTSSQPCVSSAPESRSSSQISGCHATQEADRTIAVQADGRPNSASVSGRDTTTSIQTTHTTDSPNTASDCLSPDQLPVEDGDDDDVYITHCLFVLENDHGYALTSPRDVCTQEARSYCDRNKAGTGSFKKCENSAEGSKGKVKTEADCGGQTEVTRDVKEALVTPEVKEEIKEEVNSDNEVEPNEGSKASRISPSRAGVVSSKKAGSSCTNNGKDAAPNFCLRPKFCCSAAKRVDAADNTSPNLSSEVLELHTDTNVLPSFGKASRTDIAAADAELESAEGVELLASTKTPLATVAQKPNPACSSEAHPESRSRAEHVEVASSDTRTGLADTMAIDTNSTAGSADTMAIDTNSTAGSADTMAIDTHNTKSEISASQDREKNQGSRLQLPAECAGVVSVMPVVQKTAAASKAKVISKSVSKKPSNSDASTRYTLPDKQSTESDISIQKCTVVLTRLPDPTKTQCSAQRTMSVSRKQIPKTMNTNTTDLPQKNRTLDDSESPGEQINTYSTSIELLNKTGHGKKHKVRKGEPAFSSPPQRVVSGSKQWAGGTARGGVALVSDVKQEGPGCPEQGRPKRKRVLSSRLAGCKLFGHLGELEGSGGSNVKKPRTRARSPSVSPPSSPCPSEASAGSGSWMQSPPGSPGDNTDEDDDESYDPDNADDEDNDESHHPDDLEESRVGDDVETGSPVRQTCETEANVEGVGEALSGGLVEALSQAEVEECGYDPVALALLEEMNQAETEFRCPECSMIYIKKESLTRHRNLVHGAAPVDLRCTYCGHVAKQTTELVKHSTQFHNDKHPFKCPQPGCTYCAAKISNIAKHLLTHSTVKLISCVKCRRKFKTIGHLRLHERSCYNMKRYICEVCGRRFNIDASLRQHRATMHGGARPYLCTYCGKTFTCSGNLKRHLRIHKNSFPYPCKLCKAKFRHSNTYKLHMETKHRIKSTGTNSS